MATRGGLSAGVSRRTALRDSSCGGGGPGVLWRVPGLRSLRLGWPPAGRGGLWACRGSLPPERGPPRSRVGARAGAGAAAGLLDTCHEGRELACCGQHGFSRAWHVVILEAHVTL